MNLSQSKYSLSEVCKIERLTENTPAQNVPVFYEARAFFTKWKMSVENKSLSVL